MGEVIDGRYEVVRALGQGGMGTVHLVRDRLGGGRALALKTIGDAPSAASSRDFRREFALLARLRHPHLARVVDFRTDTEGRPYLTMEVVEGDTLVERGRLPEADARRLGVELARALAYLHARGIRHGDVNPRNVMLGPAGVVLVDFGLATLRGDRRAAGTLRYAAPETLTTGAGAPADVYGLGVTLYEAVCGAPFLPGDGVLAALRDRETYEAARRAALDAAPALRETLEALLAWRPEDRPDVHHALAELAGDGPLETPETRVAYISGADLVGRDDALAQLTAWLDGDPRPALVEADAGFGKSHLVAEFRLRAQDAGFRVMGVQSEVFGDGEAVDSLLSEVLLTAPEAVVESCGPWLRWRLEHPRLDGVQAAPRIDAVADAAAWTRAAARCLREGVAGHDEPTLLVVSDLSKAGRPTRAVLEALLPADGLKLLLTTAPHETTGFDAALRVTLEPLPAAVVPRLCEASFGHLADGLEASIEQLRAAVGGRPSALFGVLRGWAERGRIDRTPAGWTLTGTLQPEDLPGDVLAAVALWLDALQLSEGELQLLRALALMRRPTGLATLGAVADVGLVPGLERRGVLVADARGRLRIAQSGAVAQLHLDADPALHRALAEAVGDPHERAYHAGCGGHPREAEWVRASLEAALEALDHRAASAAARRLAELDGGFEALFRQGELAARVGDIEDAFTAFARSLALADEAQGPRVQLQLGRLHRQQGAFAAAEMALTAALQGDERTRMEAHGELGTVRWMQTRYDDAEASYAAQLSWANSLGAADAQAAASGNLGRVYLYRQRYDEALACFERQLAEAEARGDLAQLSLALGNVGIAHRRAGRYARAMACYERKREVCERTGDRRDMGLCWGNLAVVHWYLGEADAAVRACEKQLELARAVGDRQSECSVYGNMAQFLAKRGDLVRSEARYADALALAAELGLAFYAAHYRVGRAGLFEQLERWDEAAADAAEAVRAATEMGDAGLSFDARLAVARIDAKRARAKAADAMTALLAEAGGDAQRANVHFELAELGADGDHAGTARKLYESLYLQAPTAEFRERADALGRPAPQVLPSAPTPSEGRDRDFDELLALVHRVSRQTGSGRVLEQVMELTQAFLGADRGLLLRPDAEGGLGVVAGRDQDGVELEAPEYSHTVVERVVRSRAPLFVPDILGAGDHLAEARSVRAMSLRAAMCIPLLDGSELLGAMYFDAVHETDAGRFQGQNLGYVQRLADQAVVALGHAGQLDMLEQAVAEKTREVARHVEALERSNGELERFAHVASHDLREPLRTISAFSDLLKERYADALDDQGRVFVDYILGGAERMRIMITDLLDYARLGAGLKLGPVDLDFEMKRTVLLLGGAVTESGTQLTHDPLPAIVGDSSQLQRLLQNLVSNAMKFRDPERASKVHVALVSDGDPIVMAVSDNGIGIDPAGRARIFEPFTRLHPRSRYEGTGMGLAMCRRIVEQHGGTLQVESTPGEGSRFVFTLRSVSS